MKGSPTLALPTTRPDSLMDMLDFALPPDLEASEPPEARGLTRDGVNLMVSYRSDNRIIHTRFHDLPHFLQAGDVVVINTSGTLNAALNAVDAAGSAFELHLSTRLPANLWIVELRQPNGDSTLPFLTAQAGMTLTLPAGATATLHTAYNSHDRQQPGKTRLWIATLQLPYDLHSYLEDYGFPIRYSYVKECWPSSYYQTVYVSEMGSAEMPSAGRAFTPELITQLVAKGIQFAPLILHTGVASLENHELPHEEFYRVPFETAQIINAARKAHRRIIAVGTTVVRALETVTDSEGSVHPGVGWTQVLVSPERGIHAVDALLTGLHEPHATHLAMLEALASREHLHIAYEQALAKRYLWHEFGDLHLILP